MKPSTADERSERKHGHSPAVLTRGLLGRGFEPLAMLLASLLLALACAVVLGMVVLGQPFALAVAIWQGAWASLGAAAVTITKTPPLLLTGLAVAVAYRCGILNIGCEGQLTLGALAAASFAGKGADLPA